MKISFGRFILTVSIVLFSQSYGMQTHNKQVDPGKVLDDAYLALTTKYHLIPPNQLKKNHKNWLRRYANYLIPPTALPWLQAGTYPKQSPELEESLALEVKKSVDEEARISHEANGFKNIVRRLVGGAIFGTIVGLPPALVLARIAKFFVASPPLRKAVIPYGTILAITGMLVAEIMTRIGGVDAGYRIISKHRENLKAQGLVSPAMAQQLKARPEFRNDQAAHRVIVQMTNSVV